MKDEERPPNSKSPSLIFSSFSYKLGFFFRWGEEISIWTLALHPHRGKKSRVEPRIPPLPPILLSHQKRAASRLGWKNKPRGNPSFLHKTSTFFLRQNISESQYFLSASSPFLSSPKRAMVVNYYYSNGLPHSRPFLYSTPRHQTGTIRKGKGIHPKLYETKLVLPSISLSQLQS